jgi:dipeptidyl aminopeptidase/acylaminoacyl peptidase
MTGVKRFAVALAAAVMAAGASAQTPLSVERGTLRLEGVPETPPAVAERLRQYTNAPSAAFADWIPGGGILIYARIGETTQLYRVDRPMAPPVQLTSSEERVVNAAVMPNGREILFTSDVGGNENFTGYLLDMSAGGSRAVTEAGTSNAGFIFSDDGERIAWAYATDQAGSADVVVGGAGTGRERQTLAGEGAVSPLDFTADTSKALLHRFISVSESQLFTLNLSSGAFTRITPGVRASYSGGEFTPDGRAIITISDENAQFRRLMRIDLATGARQVMTRELGRDVESFDLSRDGRVIAYVVNEAGRSSLRLMDAQTLTAIRAPRLPPGVISGLKFDTAGRRLGFTLSRATAPSDVYSWDLRAGRLTRWTRSDNAGVPPAVEPELVHWPSFDVRRISGFVYRPRSPGPHPVVIALHGGPEVQYRPVYSSAFQYWVNELGVTVIAPNVRGSSGYGKEFLALDNGALREHSVRDVGALLDWIATQPNLDRERVAVYGASYGGFLALSSLAQYNDRLAGGVSIVGIANLNSFLESTADNRRDLRREEYGDERDPEMRAVFERISPLSNISRVDRPLLVIHGANDRRVPLSEAERLVSAVRRNGGEAWLIVASNEGHGFTRRENQQAQREAEALFFQRVFGLP